MKIYKTLTYLLAASMIFSCSHKLPSYTDFNPIQKPQDKEEPKDDPTPTGPNLGYTVSPTGEDAFIDGDIVLEFKAAPVLGNTGFIKIYSSDGKEVDAINMADVSATPAKMEDNTLLTTCHDIIGAKSLDRKRAGSTAPACGLYLNDVEY